MENVLFPKKMMQILGVLLIIFIALLIISQVKTIKNSSQKMQISATGKIIGIPDVATVSIGVLSQGFNLIEVKNSNNQKMNQVINFIKQQNINNKNIKTGSFNASPRYNYENGKNNMIGYQADQTIIVKVEGIDVSQAQLEKILDGVVKQGANQIQGINFDFSDIDKWKQLARKTAIEKAKQKAKQLTDETGLTLGKIVNVIELSNDVSNNIPHMNMAQYAAKAQSVAPNINPGTQEITETISLIFEVS